LTKMSPTEHALKYTWRGSENEEILPPGTCHITVIGVGGAGNNTVTRLVEMGITGAECVAVNTDALHLSASRAHRKILVGENSPKGLVLAVTQSSEEQQLKNPKNALKIGFVMWI
jgi:cell division GTPase FtsZ